MVIDVPKVKQAIDAVKHRMKKRERKLATLVISDQQNGTLVDQSHVPSQITRNKPIHLETAINCTDQLASLIKDGIVCGPFDAPPVEGFHSNPLFMVERNNKYHLILNLSLPSSIYVWNNWIIKHP